jgi:hypothetical protein
MGRKPRVDRPTGEKWQIAQESIQSANILETCRVNKHKFLHSAVH